MTSSSPSIPPNTAATGSLGPFPTPTHGQPGAGSFTIACSAHIKASPRTCLEVLLCTDPVWNRYCRKCIIDAQPDGGQPKDKKSKSNKVKDKSNPREPVDIPVPVPESQSQPQSAVESAPGTLSATNSHSSEASSASSDHQALTNLVGPEFLRLGTKFTFHVHMDPLSEDSSARSTALQVSRLERIDEVIEAHVSEVSGAAASLPSAGGSGNGTGSETATEAAVVAEDKSSEGGDDGAVAVAPPPVKGDAVDKDTSATTTINDGKTIKAKDKGKGVASENKLQPRRTGFRIAWKTRPSLFMPSWLLHCERVQEFFEVHPPFAADDEPETAYQCWETFYGVLAPVVKTAAGSQVIRGFDVWMDGLKKRAEGVEGRGE
ncbi:hypothetical protein QBC32DRAFT_337367 [Pseudoneurospora amorphoporcata]|uniref:Uncharacterized protein n=1 Tax=Pseudoneurospora amorphoporcata TaxID=241081 RepID=A0AAN6SGZ9_9PEZI|nr:hypothetical protein QBC32DRAFT_337367 [Pseudoneurospora amorphoporcata]